MIPTCCCLFLLFTVCYLLFTICWLLFTVCCWLAATCFLLLASRCLLFAAACCSIVAVCCLIFYICPVPFATCYLLLAICYWRVPQIGGTRVGVEPTGTENSSKQSFVREPHEFNMASEDHVCSPMGFHILLGFYMVAMGFNIILMGLI